MSDSNVSYWLENYGDINEIRFSELSSSIHEAPDGIAFFKVVGRGIVGDEIKKIIAVSMSTKEVLESKETLERIELALRENIECQFKIARKFGDAPPFTGTKKQRYSKQRKFTYFRKRLTKIRVSL